MGWAGGKETPVFGKNLNSFKEPGAEMVAHASGAVATELPLSCVPAGFICLFSWSGRDGAGFVGAWRHISEVAPRRLISAH